MRVPPLVDLEDLSDYEGTPWLTALVNFCSAVGVFVGTYAAIFLAGAWHLGFRHFWPLILILACDLAVNVIVRVIRARRRRARGLSKEARRSRFGLGSRRQKW